MADKSISELQIAQSMTDDALLVVYQNGDTKSVEGALVKKYARDAVGQYVDDAARAAGEAKTAAEGALKSAEASKENADKTAADVVVVGAAAGAERERAAAEEGRVTAEKGRTSAETARKAAEDGRRTAEGERAAAETARARSEAGRGSAEEARAAAEGERKAAEGLRETGETQRSENEIARGEAEAARATAEQGRTSGEEQRTAAETARASAEAGRASAEDVRQAGETVREEAESARGEAEEARKKTEEARNLWEDYDPEKAYIPGNKVAYQGSSYVNVLECAGTAPTDAAHWLLIARRGVDGEGAGDMLANVYDPTGKAQDVFAYADAAGGKRTCRFVVGTSTAGWTARDCDYLCDGTDDQVEINAAIQALPEGGGEIFILDGTYNISDTVYVLKNNVSLKGNDPSSILKAATANYSSGAMIRRYYDGLAVSHLYFDGNKNEFPDGDFSAITTPNGGRLVNSVVQNNVIDGFDSGVHVGGLQSSVLISKNMFVNCRYGVYAGYTDNILIEGNTFRCCFNSIYMNECKYITVANNLSADTVSESVSIVASQHIKVHNNICRTENENNAPISVRGGSKHSSISGNTCLGPGMAGIDLFDSSHNIISGNTCIDNKYSGMRISGSNHNLIIGNTCMQGLGTSDDYSSLKRTIWLFGGSSHNLIIGNNIPGKDCTVDGGTGNTLKGNKWSEEDPDIRTRTITLSAEGWEGSGPYTQTVSVSGLSANSHGDIGLAQSATAEQRAVARSAMMSVTGQTAESLTVTADGDRPTVDLPAVVTVLGG